MASGHYFVGSYCFCFNKKLFFQHDVGVKELKVGAERNVSKYKTEDLPMQFQEKGFNFITTTPNVSSEVVCNRPVYSNRKRKRISNSQTKCSKSNVEGQSYTLNEDDNSKDNTIAINLPLEKFKKFDSEEYEDGEPTFIDTGDSTENGIMQSVEENDCIITNESSATVIDLLDDETEGCEEENMIEVIMCNDIEPDSSETTLELRVDFDVDNDEDAANHSIDLTTEKNIDKVDATALPTIDLTNDLLSDEDTSDNVDGGSNVIIEKIKRDLCSKYPGTVKSISRNKENNELEIHICKNSSFKSMNEFNEYLLEVATLIRDTQFIFDHPVKSANTTQQKSSRTNQNISLHKRPQTSSQPVVVLNKNYNEMQQSVLNNRRASPETHKNDHDIRLDENSTSDNLKAPNKTQIVSDYNASQILKKSVSYLGVTTETFQKIEGLLKGRLKNKFVLILLLRKIKLNEPFAILSDVLCPNKEDWIKIYEEFLPVLSRTLQGFLQWPMNCRESVAIVDIFEIEIEKPKSTIEQTISFCNQRQRYLVKFLICCTPSGYIAHVSVPFYSIHTNIFKECLDSIPKTCSTVVMNPTLSDFSKKFIRKSTIITTLDCSHDANRKCIQLIFERMRCFSVMNEILDRKNLKLLQHTCQVVACLCNLEEENK